jgi:hypothetical protein
VRINYLDEAGGDIEGPYVSLTVTEPIQRPDGSLITVGDSVLITVAVDPADLRIQLEPSGLLFGANSPTELRMWYTGASDDFDNDGVVTSEDGFIQKNLLTMAWTEGGDDPWGVVFAEHSLSDERFTAHLAHFSNYAIAW